MPALGEAIPCAICKAPLPPGTWPRLCAEHRPMHEARRRRSLSTAELDGRWQDALATWRERPPALAGEPEAERFLFVGHMGDWVVFVRRQRGEPIRWLAVHRSSGEVRRRRDIRYGALQDELLLGVPAIRGQRESQPPPPAAGPGSRDSDWGVVVQPGGGQLPYRAWPTLRNRVRTIPVTQVRRRDGVELTLEALDLYDDGFALEVRLTYRDQGRRVPEPIFYVQDDRGGTYLWTPSPAAGNQSARTIGPGQFRYEASLPFAPSLDPAAHDLVITVAQVRWRRLPSPSRVGWESAGSSDEALPGPMSFNISLAP